MGAFLLFDVTTVFTQTNNLLSPLIFPLMHFVLSTIISLCKNFLQNRFQV
ncbi:hypothetical protein B4064_0378 [Caldibacillus thermoamylovorans]|uniref:Uncharacterized protein n=1 Tax=Caldibacillus thermoamylovorans TaxID=35841 RepID=A0A0D0EU15_9BACI|nr:hypothetical protein B4166_0971 [Caldibacillus thermoamylovorans]KIO62904.1 hypothetical protein B4064_0378 [Caldibacillus thermoamylovorans]KIO67519.1 hypothetical protein B4065_0401 [Caldibacillus thermoamylovorans]KIO70315.1 hypothetical protein B4167_1007 [Caldibacillus thermoamylovorans]